MKNDTSIAIPARIGSTRLASKMLADLNGKPLIQHVIERVKCVKKCDNIFVLTDFEKIYSLAKACGVEAIMTSEKCNSGTERIASVLDKLPGRWIFNVQGDEPFVSCELIDAMISAAAESTADMLTPIFKISSDADISNPNIVKVVLDNNNNAMYFSRSAIPFVRDMVQNDWHIGYIFYGHIGIYAYRREVLANYYSLQKTQLEAAESLEQLRFLSNNYKIATVLTSYRPFAIDTKEDLDNAANFLKTS